MTKATLPIVITNISEIKANPNNPRIIKDDKFAKLVKSIKEFPEMLQIRPIVVNADMIVLGGNMRLKACKEAGLKEVPVIKATDLTDEQQREFIIKDNSGFGEWDMEVIANEWGDLPLNDWGLDIPDLIQSDEAHDDDYIVPDNIKVDIVEGDVFEIGGHRLLCGSSTNMDDLKKLFLEKTIDMVLTDPPYNVNYEGGSGLTIKNDSMNDGDFYQFLYDFYSGVNTFVKKGGAWYVWHADSEGANFRKAMKDAGILLKQCIIWVKNSFVMGRQDYQWKHEPALVGYSESEPDHEPLIYGWTPGEAHNWYSDRKQSTVIEFPKPARNAEHPTMKPIELMGKLVNNSSKKGEIVADPFLGSGSTMVACHQLGRICYGMELDPKYCQVIIDRMKKLDPALIIKRNGKLWE